MTQAAIDTNILVYRYHPEDDAKRTTAARLLHHLSRTDTGVIPAQCLAELSSVTLTKLPTRWTPGELSDVVQHLRRAFTILPLTAAVVAEAVRGVQDHQLSYYDAQVWAAARLAQTDVVISEDFNTGSTLDGVTFVNPFTDAGQQALAELTGWKPA